MTRINVGYCPAKLTDKMLIAEHREIKRIPNAVLSGKARIENIPEQFTLGTGHVKFFYNKLGYLLSRYRSLYHECKRRGFNVTDFSSAWCNAPADLCVKYKPSKRDKRLIVNRINSKLNM